jgi:hypothetical protein
MTDENLTKEGMEEPTPPEPEKTPDTQDGEGEDPKDKIIAQLRQDNATLAFQKNRWREKAESAGEPEGKSIKSPVSSDGELASRFPEWELMTDTEKRLAKGQFKLEKEISSQREIGKRITLNEQIEELSFEPEYAALAEKTAEFRKYCLSDENRGVPVSVLAKSFLYEDAKRIGAEEERKKAERKGLETGSAGPRTPAKSKGLSAEELKDLRENNPDAYRDYLIKK